jgi:hypothetical protein
MSSEFCDLEVVLMNLETSLQKLEGLTKKPMPTNIHGGNVHLEPGRPHGPNGVPTTHEAIHCHSRVNLHPAWIWITKSSTVNNNVRIGFPATEVEVRRFGAKARKIFLRDPPSVL